MDPGLRRDDGMSAVAVRTKKEMNLRPRCKHRLDYSLASGSPGQRSDHYALDARFRGHDGNAGGTYADFGNLVLGQPLFERREGPPRLPPTASLRPAFSVSSPRQIG
jgi:hypothetical protein